MGAGLQLSSLHEELIFREKTSAASVCTASAADNVQTTIQIGHGVFRVEAMELDTDVEYLMLATMGYKPTTSSGSTRTLCFARGWISKYHNLVLGSPKFIEGPGLLYSNVVFLEADKTSILTVGYRSIRKQYQGVTPFGSF